MELIEFLERTDHRSLKYNIGYMVKQRFRQRDEELAVKRQRLYHILDSEKLQYDEELALMLRERIQQTAYKRAEWIGTQRIEREKAEQELLQLKQQQRELENCEAYRHLQSKQILIETKLAQRYQIEEKRAMRRREQRIEQLWLEAWQQLHDEKEKQEIYERKLRRIIDNLNQAKNCDQDVEQKSKHKFYAEELKKEHDEDNTRAWKMECEFRTQAGAHERWKKLQQCGLLQDQIRENRCHRTQQKIQQRAKDNFYKKREDREIQKQLFQQMEQKIQNREWHKQYLEHTLNEKQAAHAEVKEFDDMLVGTGCVLQQQEKRPYGKQVR